MSSRWMLLTEHQKKIYKEEAEGAMERYRGEMAAWQSVQKEKLKEAKHKKPAPEPEAEAINANPRAQVNSNNPAALQQALNNQQGISSQLGGMLNQNGLGSMQQPNMAQLLGAGGLDPQMQQLLMNNQAMLGGMGMGMGGLGFGGMGGLQGGNMGGLGLGGGNMGFGGGQGMGMFQNDQLAQLQFRQQQQLQQQQFQQQQQFGGMQHQQQNNPQQFNGLHQNGLSPQLGSMGGGGGGGDTQQQQLLQEYLRQQQLQQQQGM